MSRRARVTVAHEVASAVRVAFEPRYGRVLEDAEVGEIADNFKRLHAVLSTWDAEDRAGLRSASPPPTASSSPREHIDLPVPVVADHPSRSGASSPGDARQRPRS